MNKLVKSYSLATHGELRLSANFLVREFRCKDGSDPIFIEPELIKILQDVRDHFRKPVNINSAYRTPQHNTAVGGVGNSRHMYGMAADIWVRGETPEAVYSYLCATYPGSLGIGIYSWGCHVDTGGFKRWDNR